jgi:hypothetical protein
VLGLILTGKIHDPLWLLDAVDEPNKKKRKTSQQETAEQNITSVDRWLPSQHYVPLLQSIYRHSVALVEAWQAEGYNGRVAMLGRGWAFARQKGMDAAFGAPFAPLNNVPLSATDSTNIRVMYQEMCVCMEIWRKNGAQIVDAKATMPTVWTRANRGPKRVSHPC